MLLIFYFILKILFWVKNFHAVALSKGEISPHLFFLSLEEESFRCFWVTEEWKKCIFPVGYKKGPHFYGSRNVGEIKLKAETCILVYRFL